MVAVKARMMRCYLINEDVEDLEETLQPRYRPGEDDGFIALPAYGNVPYGTIAYLERPGPLPEWARALDSTLPG